MTKHQDIYKPDPGADADVIVDGFLREFGQRALGDAALDVTTIRQRAHQLAHQHAARTPDQVSAHNLRYACAILAAHEALIERGQTDGAVPILREAFSAAGDFVRYKTRAGLDASADPFSELVNVSKAREAVQFGTGFDLARVQDDDHQYLLDVRRCLWNDFFVDVGRPELTVVLCDFDSTWFTAIDPARHGFRFQRETTLGYGGGHCPFHFIRNRPRGPGV